MIFKLETDLSRKNDDNHFWALFEIALIFFVFFLYAGWPVPAVNEAHYLTKAKHYWNPDWCAGDLFLESADAHLFFYWTVGWLTRFFSLSTTAWIGRIVTWGLLAWSWRRLSVRLAPGRLAAVLTASLFLAFLHWFHMGGEWIVGGLEAKGFAYVFVLLGLRCLVDGQWGRTILLCGAATSFHVLVGGWSLIAMGVAWLASGSARPRWSLLAPALLGGFLLAAPGLMSGIALSRGVEAETVAQANRIYVYERLSHHLVFHRFDHFVMVRHLALLLFWAGLWRYLPHDEAKSRLHRFVLGAVVIAGMGILVDQATLYHQQLAASLLRFYWFRLSDAMLPLGAAFSVMAGIDFLKHSRPKMAQAVLAAAIVLTSANVGWQYWLLQGDMLPGADRQVLTTTMKDRRTLQNKHQAWREVCRWAATNTDSQDRFLTPRHQQTFKWHAERSEAVSRKDVPQDAAGIVAWWRRFQEVYPKKTAVGGLAAHSDLELSELMRRYDCRYVVVDRSYSQRAMSFIRVYPAFNEANEYYAVYMLPPEIQPTAPSPESYTQ